MTAPAFTPLSSRAVYRTSDPEVATREATRLFARHRLHVVDGPTRFDAMANVGDLSGVAINYVTFGTPVQIERPPTGTYLGLMVPLAGRLTVEHEGQAFQADPALGTGVVLGPGADDGDLFVALQKFDAAGKLVNFPYFTLQNDGQAAHGWQRISHRELDTRPDPRRARIPGQPIHPHQREVRAAEG